MPTKNPSTKKNSNPKSPPLLKQAPQPKRIASKSTTRKATKVVVKYDVGFGNTLYIRGKGANLNWEKGIPLKNVKGDEWVWESETTFKEGEFKVLINDKLFETGHNHPLKFNTTHQYTPHFIH